MEDDRGIAEAIAAQTALWDMETVCVKDFRRVLAEFSECAPQLVLLDISLPFFDGYHWCREIRTVSKVPVIFISSAADSMNIVLAMHQGGDDFVAKPFDLTVLTAKMQALLRRTYEFARQDAPLPLQDGFLNLSDGTLVRGEQQVELTRNELRIAEMLLEHRGRTVSREALMERLWSTDSFVDENTLSVNVNRLRKKMEALGFFDPIRTRKGEGYLIPS